MAFKNVKAVVFALMCVPAIGQPVEEFLDWEDFQAALVEDGSDEGISLLQSKVKMKFTSLPKTDSLSDLESKSGSADAMDDISPDAFAESMSEEKVPEAVSLMQTEAHVHRSANHQSVPTAMVTNADGSVATEKKYIVPQDGVVHMSVGVDGSLSWEDATEGLSLIQKEATLTTGSKMDEPAKEEHSSMNDVSADSFKEALESSVEGAEAVSLLQTDAHVHKTSIKTAMVTEADGSIGLEREISKPHDGMIHMSIGAHGTFQWEI